MDTLQNRYDDSLLRDISNAPVPTSNSIEVASLKEIWGSSLECHYVKDNSHLPMDRVGDNSRLSGVIEFLFVFVIIVIASYTGYIFRRTMSRVAISVMYENVSKELERGAEFSVVRYNLIASFAYTVTLAVFITNILPGDIMAGEYHYLLMPVVFLVIHLHLVWRKMVLFTIQFLSRGAVDSSSILFYNRLYRAAWFIYLLPVSFFSFADGKFSMVNSVIGIIFVLLLFFQIIKREYTIFRLQNISFFQYILYLCSTEMVLLGFLVPLFQ